ncbi:MAG: cyclic nucleotide-binding domain-containing protein [Myxococcota bacterium]|nr:cyclic nucleotide-binding domain-containing protein [Myxococcota bacterium]
MVNFDLLTDSELLNRLRARVYKETLIELPQAHDSYLIKKLTELCMDTADWTPERVVTTLFDDTEKSNQALKLLVRYTLKEDHVFFRSLKSFKFIRHRCIPEILQTYPKTETLNIWVIDTRHGQEVYSMATMLDMSQNTLQGIPYKIYASRISETEMTIAKEGHFTHSEVRAGLPESVLENNFVETEQGWEVHPKHRNNIEFLPMKPLDAVNNLPKLHLVIAKGSLIFLTDEARNRLYAQLEHVALPGAFLILGPGESIEVPSSYEKIVQYKSVLSYQIRPMKSGKKRSGQSSQTEDKNISPFKKLATVAEQGQELSTEDYMHLARFVRQTNLFFGLTAEQVDDFCQRLTIGEFSSHDVIIDEGEPNHYMYIIISGTASVIIGSGLLRKPREIATLHSGDLFGEMSLIQRSPSTATVKATSPLKTICVASTQFDALYEENTKFASQIRTLVAKRQQYNEAFKNKRYLAIPTLGLLTSEGNTKQRREFEIDWKTLPENCREVELNKKLRAAFTSFIRAYRIFEKMDFEAIDQLWRYIRLIELPEKICLIKEGQKSPAVFIIYSGEVSVTTGQSFFSPGNQAASLGEGDIFGEMSVIMKEPASATVLVKSQTVVFVITPKLFEYFYENNPAFSEELKILVKSRMAN